MADLFLHLPFARRLRLAEGLHPMVGEALTRRPALVCLGASLAHLPANERKNMSFLRRLFSRGGEAAKWQKLLGPAAGVGRVDLIASVLQKGEAPGGSMMRLATALGLLSADCVEESLAPITATLPPNERAGIERAQARLWLQATIANPKDLEREWRVVQELGESDLQKNAVAHLDRAIQRAHGASPGEAVLMRWLKGLAADAVPLLDFAKSGGLPATLGQLDSTVKGPHFESNAYLEKAQSAVSRFVFLANRLAEALAPEVEKDAVVAALTAEGKLLDVPGTLAEVQQVGEAAKTRWREWLTVLKDAALTRGRNPKPAYGEGEESGESMPRSLPHNPSATGVMRLTDIPDAPLPPEAEGSGAPPMPEQSGANIPPAGGITAPALTQEVSVAQIEAETAAARAGLPANPDDFATPAHTQEVSVAMIEDLRPAAQAPASDMSTTQPIQPGDIVATRSSNQPSAEGAPATTSPTPTSDHTDEHKNGKTEAAPQAAPQAEPAPPAPSDGTSATDPPRE